MKNRRAFLKKGAILASAAIVSGPLMAKSKKEPGLHEPGLIFTESEQGKWDGKAGSHVPKVSVKNNKVTLFTDHGMSESHYIVRHTLVDTKGNMLGSKTFSGNDEAAKSTFELPANFKGTLYATSYCNKHDFWVNEFSV